ncbi:MAG TPA: PASTA domain-containing protein [Bacteroidales bacterium]|nr:PASTA domain-containing protein [Bacteroidales bacterium]HPT01235.1 PASTA domain-containing protein [Bacteroidales bacterium]
MNFIQFITTRKFVKHFLLSVLITIVLAWIILMILKQYTRHGETVTVPKITGLTLAQAQELESSDDFNYVVVDSVFDLTKKGGTITMQDPLPNSIVKPGRIIYISVVATVPEKVKMPDLVDLSIRQAKALLETYGLRLGNVSMIPDIAKNMVLRMSHNGSSISPGTSISKGSTIDLVVGLGTGSGAFQIPFLIGKTRAEAQVELQQLGLLVGDEKFIDGDSLDARVYQQNPAYVYGLTVRSSSAISLTYRSSESFDFDTYIKQLVIDTIQNDSASIDY